MANLQVILALFVLGVAGALAGYEPSVKYFPNKCIPEKKCKDSYTEITYVTDCKFYGYKCYKKEVKTEVSCYEPVYAYKEECPCKYYGRKLAGYEAHEKKHGFEYIPIKPKCIPDCKKVKYDTGKKQCKDIDKCTYYTTCPKYVAPVKSTKAYTPNVYG